MARAPKTRILIDDCGQQLFKLRKSLAELKKINAQGWEFLTSSFSVFANRECNSPRKHRTCQLAKKAEEAHSLVDTMRNAHTLTLFGPPTGSKAVARQASYNTISKRNRLPI
jgi:hypothetical protein